LGSVYKEEQHHQYSLHPNRQEFQGGINSSPIMGDDGDVKNPTSALVRLTERQRAMRKEGSLRPSIIIPQSRISKSEAVLLGYEEKFRTFLAQLTVSNLAPVFHTLLAQTEKPSSQAVFKGAKETWENEGEPTL
jgi:hypothetical protein